MTYGYGSLTVAEFVIYGPYMTLPFRLFDIAVDEIMIHVEQTKPY